MQTIEQVQAAWASLTDQAKIEAWDEFTRSIDYGDQGYDPYYLVLWPMWEAGVDPTAELIAGIEVDDAQWFDPDPDFFPMTADVAFNEQHIPF